MASLGVLLTIRTASRKNCGWRAMAQTGSRFRSSEAGFPDAFIGTMANLQRFSAGQDATLWTAVDDCIIHTMALASGALPQRNRLSRMSEERV